jgi:hypothetical protein
MVAAYADAESFVDLMGTELMGGTVTGPMINLAAIGALLFLAAAVLVLIQQRASAITGVAAVPFCIPLSIYRIFPRFFVRIVGGEWAGPPHEVFKWHVWSIIGILAATVVVYLAAGILRRRQTRYRVV